MNEFDDDSEFFFYYLVVLLIFPPANWDLNYQINTSEFGKAFSKFNVIKTCLVGAMYMEKANFESVACTHRETYGNIFYIYILTTEC